MIINIDDGEGNIDDETPFGRLLSSISVGSSTESLKLLLNFIVLMLRAAMITCGEKHECLFFRVFDRPPLYRPTQARTSLASAKDFGVKKSTTRFL